MYREPSAQIKAVVQMHSRETMMQSGRSAPSKTHGNPQKRLCARCTDRSRRMTLFRAEEYGGGGESGSTSEEEDEEGQGCDAVGSSGWPAVSAADAGSWKCSDDHSGGQRLRSRSRRQFSNRVKEECWRRAEEVPGRHPDS